MKQIIKTLDSLKMSNRNLEGSGSSGVLVPRGVVVRVPFEQTRFQGLGRQPKVLLGLGRLLRVHLGRNSNQLPFNNDQIPCSTLFFQPDLLVEQKINKENKEHIASGSSQILKSPQFRKKQMISPVI